MVRVPKRGRHLIGRLSKTAVLIALAIALGYILAAVPNVEAISAVAFFSGYLLGLRSGAVVGGVSMLLFSLFNPLGPPVPPVFVAQILGMAMIGSCGDLWRRLVPAVLVAQPRVMAMIGSGGDRWRRLVTAPGKAELLAMCFGALLTLLYSLAVDYGFAVSMGRWRDPLPVIAAGLPFSVLHIVSNTLIFGGVSAFVVRKYRLRVEDERR